MELRRPGKSRLLVLIDEKTEQQTSSGLFIAPAHTITKFGKILAVGDCSTPFNVGDTVCMGNGSGMEIGDGELILHENEIFYTKPS